LLVRGVKGWIAIVVALLPATITCPALAAGTPTRSEYVSTLERICKPDVLATQRVMKGVRSDVRAERDAVAARKFGRGAAIFARTVRDIGAVRRPPADTARLHKWFVYLGRQKEYLKQVTARLRAGETIRAQRATARFIHNGNLANNVVLAFGFNYCSFRFSRFG
jgi:hypothetical protein